MLIINVEQLLENKESLARIVSSC